MASWCFPDSTEQVKFTQTSALQPLADAYPHFLAKSPFSWMWGGADTQPAQSWAGCHHPTSHCQLWLSQKQEFSLSGATSLNPLSLAGLYLPGMSQNCPLLGKESTGDYVCYSLLPDWQTNPYGACSRIQLSFPGRYRSENKISFVK